MALNKAQLEALNNSVFPDNNTGEITPEDLRLFNSSSIAAYALEAELTSVSASFATSLTTITGSQGPQGVQGPQGTQGVQGEIGPQGTQGTQGFQGVQGTQGEIGPQGTQGVQGPQGNQGANGTSGVDGQSNAFFDYKANTNDISGDPGSTYLLWNNAIQTSSTQINVSHLTRDGYDIDVFLGLIPSGSTVILQDIGNSANFQKWVFGTGTEVSPNSYWTFPATYVSGGYSFGNNQELLLIVAQLPAGPQGPQGSQGPQGTQGVQGVQGAQGVQGEVGAQGTQGTQGVQGLTGDNGTSGTSFASPYTGSIRGNISTLSVTSATASIDASLANFFTLSVPSSSITYITGSNFNPGQTVNLLVTQGGTTGSLRFEPTLFKFSSGSVYTGSAVINSTDIVSFVTFNSTTALAASLRNLV